MYFSFIFNRRKWELGAPQTTAPPTHEPYTRVGISPMTLPWLPHNLGRRGAAGAELPREGSGAGPQSPRRDRTGHPGSRLPAQPRPIQRPRGPRAEQLQEDSVPDPGVARREARVPPQPVPAGARQPLPRLGTTGHAHAPFPGFQMSWGPLYSSCDYSRAQRRRQSDRHPGRGTRSLSGMDTADINHRLRKDKGEDRNATHSVPG